MKSLPKSLVLLLLYIMAALSARTKASETAGGANLDKEIVVTLKLY